MNTVPRTGKIYAICKHCNRVACMHLVLYWINIHFDKALNALWERLKQLMVLYCTCMYCIYNSSFFSVAKRHYDLPDFLMHWLWHCYKVRYYDVWAIWKKMVSMRAPSFQLDDSMELNNLKVNFKLCEKIENWLYRTPLMIETFERQKKAKENNFHQDFCLPTSIHTCFFFHISGWKLESLSYLL